ncbi:MAG: hypothetical protein ABEH64_02195 [Salinirussus sp.]
MAPDLPTGSVTGREGWQWNRTRDERPSPASVDEQQHTREEMSNATLRREVRRLEAELERKDDQLNRVIAHYERLLSERTRRLQHRRPGEEQADDDTAVITAVRTWLTRR